MKILIALLTVMWIVAIFQIWMLWHHPDNMVVWIFSVFSVAQAALSTWQTYDSRWLWRQ